MFSRQLSLIALALALFCGSTASAQGPQTPFPLDDGGAAAATFIQRGWACRGGVWAQVTVYEYTRADGTTFQGEDNPLPQGGGPMPGPHAADRLRGGL